jgi:hypothetical protein
MIISFKIDTNHFERTEKEVELHSNFTSLIEINVNVHSQNKVFLDQYWHLCCENDIYYLPVE